MITLNMTEASMALTVENAALLPPCHNQSSWLRAVFCGTWRRLPSKFALRREFVVDHVLDLFLRRAMFAP
jgi:hypothetical protein